ncbi:GUN4 domain-containing protein [Leptolyngbya sp. CCNP1308]|uniref:GUN4 domain-containing protein n=1 Tax=Leptolyngbya sp. CCNP1308 TaxID=3110255 RepID=UPI002B1F96D8|nr:GUN4 domain-containing protein [Leptolyngbya sp. CCNP1308]MEA5451205.1 GUN4 domain-containing protein [Leptolyngbya sp. CCNP1308]
MTEQQFDVFLAHSSKDKPLIRRIYRKLADLGIRPWLDEEEIAPGTTFQSEIQQAIGRIKSAAIFFGPDGLGRWQALELKSFISQCVRRGVPVIPVLLPGVEEIPEELIFLQEFHAVSFQDSIEDERALFSLEWGITQRKPTRQYSASQVLGNAYAVPPPTSEDDLSSERGIDYQNLRNLLKAGKWREADQETYRLMIITVGKKEGQWFDRKDLEKFPCEDLRTLDQLWVKYSNGKFGFGVQKQIYVETGNLLDGEYHEENWKAFCDCVGWRKGGKYLVYSDLKANSSLSPTGEFPRFCRGMNFVISLDCFSSLAQRLVYCCR